MTPSPQALCVACGGCLSPFGRRLQYTYMRCRDCGSIQLYPMPDKAQMIRSYEEEYASASHYGSNPEICTRAAQKYYKSIMNALKDYAVKGPVLDYGAGWGGLCDLLIRNGFQCRGVEISRQMAAYCSSRGIPVEEGDMKSLKGSVFSALVLCTVFEHLVDFDLWLMQASNLLALNGLLVTLQPAGLFANFVGRLLRLGNLGAPLPRLGQVFCPPWHTAFFSFEGMKTLAHRNGFDLLEVRSAPQGRHGGLTGLAQISLEMFNRFGWALMGTNWPMVTAHLFILRKRDDFSSRFRRTP